ncbi:MAG TPA: hypothetical protein ENG40_03455 [Thermoprotei archaeon]|nr:hypothetical protein [Thermoprotei archaeon]
MKLRVKPVFVSHEEAFFRKLPSAEKIKEKVDRIMDELTRNIEEYVSLEKPAILTSFNDIDSLLMDISRDIDVFIGFRIGGMGHRLLAKVGLLKLPLILLGPSVINYDIAAYVKELGGEVYVPLNYTELNRVLKYLYIRKKLSRSKILYISSKGLPPFSVISGACNLEKLREKFGIETISISSEQLFEEYSKISNIDVEEDFNELVGKAGEKHVDDKEIFKALRLHKAILNLIKKYNVDMMAISCAEPIYYREKVTPCLSISLLKDMGIPAACEGDLSLLMGTIFLMELSGKAAFIGNLWPHNIDKNIFRISHDVPSIKMRGFKERGYRYSIYDFHDQKYGVTLYVDLELDKNVTLARMHMSLDKLLVIKGKVISSYQGINCRQTLDIIVENSKKLLRKLPVYGHHFALVYGDYVEEIVELSEILGFKADVI